jgi:hypothetical protein
MTDEQIAALVEQIRRTYTDDLIDALEAENARLRDALDDCLLIIDIIDAYQKRVGLGEYGTECACCRGELFDDGERPLIAAARATLAQETQP